MNKLSIVMSIKVGGFSLILSMINRRFRSNDSPNLWRKHFEQWRSTFGFNIVQQWLSSLSLLKILEILILTIIVLAWGISLIKEII